MYSSSMPLGPGGVDVLGNLTSKMEQQLQDTEHVRTLFDANVQMFKNKQISKKEFVHKVITYTISLSALNFLVTHVILEMRTALEKGTSMKDTTGGTVMEDSSVPGSQFSFGIEGFLGGSPHGGSGDGGDILTCEMGLSTLTNDNNCRVIETNRTSNRMTFRRGQQNSGEFPIVSFVSQHCDGCGKILLRNTKFCGKCGYRQ